MMCLCFVYDDMMVCVYVLFSQLACTPPPPPFPFVRETAVHLLRRFHCNNFGIACDLLLPQGAGVCCAVLCCVVLFCAALGRVVLY